MSADNEDGVILKGLWGGAAFFIRKPISVDDVKDLWQYAISLRQKPAGNKPTPVKEIGGSADNLTSDSIEGVEIESSANRESQDSKRKPYDDHRANSSASTEKKKKIVWTNDLHHRFLEAIRILGSESKTSFFHKSVTTTN